MCHFSVVTVKKITSGSADDPTLNTQMDDERCIFTHAPQVPPPLTRRKPVLKTNVIYGKNIFKYTNSH